MDEIVGTTIQGAVAFGGRGAPEHRLMTGSTDKADM